MKKKRVKRIYTTSDAHMSVSAGVMHKLLETDIAVFTAFDNNMNAAYLAEYNAAVVAAEAVVRDSTIKSVQAEKTETVETVMEKARKKFHHVKFFVKKAFENSIATQHEFGLKDYGKLRDNTTKMIGFLDLMHGKCVLHSAPLIAAGFSAAGIAEIETIMNELSASSLQQHAAKKERPVLTDERIVTLNTCYSFMAQVNAAAQLVFSNDYAKQKQYRFYEKRKKKKVELL
ncbi:MAG: hypothetical protein U0U67_03125 [Chitinophagales bacterium]